MKILIDLSLCSRANLVALQTAKHSAVKIDAYSWRELLLRKFNRSHTQADPTAFAPGILLPSVKICKLGYRSFSRMPIPERPISRMEFFSKVFFPRRFSRKLFSRRFFSRKPFPRKFKYSKTSIRKQATFQIFKRQAPENFLDVVSYFEETYVIGRPEEEEGDLFHLVMQCLYGISMKQLLRDSKERTI